MRVREFFSHSIKQLTERCVLDPGIEAEVIIRNVLGLSRAELIVISDEFLSSDNKEQLFTFLDRRMKGEPLAYIFNQREFYGLDFVVTPEVLIPRQESELLVDKVLEHADRVKNNHLKIIDVGTGSGVLAITIARYLPDAIIYATDVSRKALFVADTNRCKHGVSDRVYLCQTDLLQAINGPIDIVVSNPPYLNNEEMLFLAPELKHEPRCALDGGIDGLWLTRRLFQQASVCLESSGCLVVEISTERLHQTMQIAEAIDKDATVLVDNDLAGSPRVMTVKFS